MPCHSAPKLFMRKSEKLYPVRRKLRRTFGFFKSGIDAWLGFILAQKIVSEDQTVHYFIMDKHLGDILHNLPLLTVFKDYYSENEPYHFQMNGYEHFRKAQTVRRMVVITSESAAGVARLFGCVDEVITLSRKELFRIGLYAKQYSCMHTNLHRDDYDAHSLRENAAITGRLMSVWPYRIVLNVPGSRYRFAGTGHLFPISAGVPERAKERAVSFIKSKGIEPGGFVILVPYSKSSSMLKEEEWRPVIERLQDRGYALFTNTGKGEAALPGTEALMLPIDEYAALAEMSRAVIGVQSGAADIISEGLPDSPMICLHPMLRHADFIFAENRGVKGKKEYKYNTCHILALGDEIKKISDIILPELAIYEKGALQRKAYEESGLAGVPDALREASEINAYILELSRIGGLTVFITGCRVKESVWAGIDLAPLGLAVDGAPGEGTTYIGVYGSAEGAVCSESDEEGIPLVFHGVTEDEVTLKNGDGEEFARESRYYLSSFAPKYDLNYSTSSVVINGSGYAVSGTGFNIVVYSAESGRVIDSVCARDLGDGRITVERER